MLRNAGRLGTTTDIWAVPYSNHSLFAVTGSFFNPGPYSGYLAMVFPICLNEWLALKAKKNKTGQKKQAVTLL